jgi:hypothetical protein
LDPVQHAIALIPLAANGLITVTPPISEKFHREAARPKPLKNISSEGRCLPTEFRLKLFGSSRRFRFMSEFSNKQFVQPKGGVAVSDTDARQARSGMGVRYVLAISLGAAVIVLAAVYFVFGF